MDITTIFQSINIVFISKVFFIILLGVYIIFIFMLITKTRSFDKIIAIEGGQGSSLLKTMLIIYLFALLFLFVVALVIV